MSKFEFLAEVRNERGKAAARRMRRKNDRVPAVVYGAGKDSQSISLPHKDILHALEDEAIYSRILKLTVNGQDEQVIIKEIQRHAYKPKIAHVDFLRVKAKEKITLTVPLRFLGEEEAPGAKEGGKFTKSITELEIRCLPADLPEFLALDVAKMQLDQTLHLSDLTLPSGVELAHLEVDEAHDHPIIALHVPRVVRADIEAEQHETEIAEGAAAETEESKLEKGESESSEGKGSTE